MAAGKTPEFKELKDANLVMAAKYAAMMRALREVSNECLREMNHAGRGAELAMKIDRLIRDLPGVASG